MTDLRSNRVLPLENGEVYLSNKAIVSGSYADDSAMNTKGFAMLALRVDGVTGNGLSVEARGNITDSNLQPLSMYDSDMKPISKIQEIGLYYVSVNHSNSTRIFCRSDNTATAITLRIGKNFNDLTPMLIERRKKAVNVASTFRDVPANDVAEYFWNRDLDVSEFSYVLIRIRTRDATINTYEARDFKVDIAWDYDVAEGVSTASVNGGSPLVTVIDTSADPTLDARTDWIEIQAARMSIVLYNRETTVKRYEMNVIGIR